MKNKTGIGAAESVTVRHNNLKISLPSRFTSYGRDACSGVVLCGIRKSSRRQPVALTASRSRKKTDSW
ncbi:MAG: hypothetical protein D3914_06135 [Candidatus Electrothrix sp. LOE2]|nr:hypothetical protein [Candidatus Electrothrix sp. LOE2]